MTRKTIRILINGCSETAIIDYEEKNPWLMLTLGNGQKQKYTGQDIYECFGKMIKSFPKIRFLCKGAKINVRPSSMSSQMTSGVMAYQHNLGTKASRKDVVNIFDYDDEDIINDPQLQTDFFFTWLDSLK